MSLKQGEEMLESYVVDTYSAASLANPIIISVTLSVMVIYLLAYLVVAIREKTKLPKSCLHMPFGDALENSDSYYVVTIATGLRAGAGLKKDGVVRVNLSCTLNDPEPLVISNVKTPGSSPLLQRGGVDQFLLPTKGNLGDILAIDVDLQSINNEDISWYVKYIRVSDVCFGIHSYFVFDRWLKTCDYMRTGVHQAGISQGREFLEKFMEIFVDLNIWTAALSRSCELSAFSRSIRLSFSAFVLSCVMVVNILVCLIPAIQKQTRNEPIPGLPQLIRRNLGMGFGASLIVFLLQYSLEILLRRIKIQNGDRDLLTKGRNMWKKKPLPMSLYPMYVNRLSQNLPQKPKHWEARFEEYGNGSEIPAVPYAPEKEVAGKLDKLTNRKTYRLGYKPLSSVEEVDTLAEDEDMEVTLTQGETSYSADQSDVKTYTPTDFIDDFGFPMNPETLHDNKNGNNITESQQSVTEFNEMIESALWDEQTGVVSGYLKEKPKSENYRKKSPAETTEHHEQVKSLAGTLVSALADEARENLQQKNSPPLKAVNAIQEQVNDSFLYWSEQWERNLLGNVKSQADESETLKAGSSEGQMSVGSKSSSPSKSGPPSVTSSCPEVNRSPGGGQVNLGPVAKKLAESVSAAASRNSMTVLQTKSSSKLAEKSVERMTSLSSLATKVQVSDKILLHPANTETNEELGKKERASMTNLVDYITPHRITRLTENSMRLVARASLKSLTSDAALQKLKGAAKCHNEKATESFTQEVVNNLYQVVRAKMENLLESEEHKAREGLNLNDLLTAADEEVKQSVIPPLIDYVESLMMEQAKSLYDIDVDLVMMAFSGQYIDTIITNAVLQTHVGLLKAKESLQDMKKEVLAQDSNVNNNKNFELDRALIILERTAELEDVMTLLCKCMLESYKNSKGSKMDDGQEKDEAILTAFRKNAATYEAFERILTESSHYLRRMSENMDLAGLCGEGKLMTELSERFLCEGFNVDEHVEVTENLSERLTAMSLQHACRVVAEDLVEPFLQANLDVLTLEGTQNSQPQYKVIKSEGKYSQTAEKPKKLKKSDTGSSSRYSRQSRQKQSTKVQLTNDKMDSPKRLRYEEWHDQSKKRTPTGKPEDSPNKSTPKTVNRSTYLDGSTRTPTFLERKPNNSPLTSSTPKPVPIHSDPLKVPSWPDMDSVPFIKTEDIQLKTPPAVSHDKSQRRTKNEGPVTNIMFEDSEVNSLASVPICPPSPVGSYGWTHPTIAGTSWSRGLPYIPPDNESFPAASKSEQHLERVWRLDLEKDITGETSKCLPQCIMLILHAIISIMTVASLSTCIMFGLRLPMNIAISWIVALVLVIFVHAFIFETVKVMIVSLYYVCLVDETL